MREEKWAEILHVFYKSADGRISKGVDEQGYNVGKCSKLVTLTRMDVEEVEKGIAYLGRIGLIEEDMDADNNKTFQLTESGFDVAHDLYMQTQQASINLGVAKFTYALILVGVGQMIVEISLGTDLPYLLNELFLIAPIAFLLGYLSKYGGVNFE